MCTDKALELLATLPEKWDPKRVPDEMNVVVNPEGDWEVFDPQLVMAMTIKDVFRVFTDGDQSNALLTMQQAKADVSTIQLATDGSCEGQGEQLANAGFRIFYAEGDPRNLAVKVPNTMAQMNQVVEMLALLEAIQANPVTRSMRKMENEGYISTMNADIIKRTVEVQQERENKDQMD
ncbi:hypothetical protein BDN71DRAFT_1436573 [Pleurotus eryngii]|uniref:Uncharacterized protein n=1 Tax=Pleurotus eryngii TaxID=5323 RepID=A0A9P5ZI00_PLEER|nr:hypothetical protein BDN71DRAFT_1436573 [Pleurotus eryngii]